MDIKQYITKYKDITGEIRKGIKRFLETNDNEITVTPNLWDSSKAVLRGKFIVIQSYLKKQEKHQIATSKKTRPKTLT